MIAKLQLEARELIRKASIILAAVGLLDALYLSWIKLANQEAVCYGVGDCATVNASQFAEIGGIPIAVLGAGAYLVILLALWREERSAFLRENGPLIVFGISLVGVLYSAYLTYIELFVIHAVCPYCVLSAVVLVLLLLLSGIRLRQQWDLA